MTTNEDTSQSKFLSEILQNILYNVRLPISIFRSKKTAYVKQLMLKFFFDSRFQCNIT